MKTITEQEAQKLSLLNLVRNHREHCGPDCGVSLDRILQIAELAGIPLTWEERALFS